MDEIGNILREARESSGATLGAAQEQLKIQQKYLVALEDGRFEELPTPVHVRGYLKNYAKYLGLDPQPLLDSYQTSLLNGGRRARPKADDGVVPPREGNPFFNPVNLQLNPNQNESSGDSMLRIIIIIALLAAILLVASRFFVTDGRESTVGDLWGGFTAWVSGETPPTAEDINTDEILDSAAVQPPENIIETGRGEITDAAVPTSVPVLELPTDLEIINATVETMQSVFLVVVVDGETVLQEQVAGGETLDYTAQQQLDISMGNAFAVVLSINGVEYGRMGEPRQTRDISLTVGEQ